MRELERQSVFSRIGHGRIGEGARTSNGYRHEERCFQNNTSASFLFFNFPMWWEVKNMWETFRKYRNLVDIYMAQNRLRNGKKFGFLRFKNGSRERNETDWSTTRNRESHNHQYIPKRDDRTYSEVAKGNKDGEIKTSVVGKNTRMRNVVGSAKDVEFLDSIEDICKAEGLDDFETKLLGGLDIMVKCVPVDGWSENVFRQVAEEWGSPFEFANCDFNESFDLRVGRVLILTERINKIIYSKNMIFNGTQRLIRIIKYSAEDGWESRKHRSDDTTDYSLEMENIIPDSDDDERDDGHWENQKVQKDETLLSRVGKFKVCMEQVKDMQQEGVGQSTPKEDVNVSDSDPEKSNCCKVNEQNAGNVDFDCDVNIGGNVGNGPKSLGSIGFHKTPLHDILTKPDQQTGFNGPNEVETNHGLNDNLETHMTKAKSMREVAGEKTKINNVVKVLPPRQQRETAIKIPTMRNICNKANSEGNSRTTTISESRNSIENPEVKHLGEKLGFKWVEDKGEKVKSHVNVDVNGSVADDEGLGSDGKTKWVCELISKEKPLVFGLQESKMDYMDKNIIRYMWGSDAFGYSIVNAVGSSGGILTVWDNTWFFDIKVIGEEEFLIVVGSWKGRCGQVGFINVYAPHDIEVKANLWDKISMLINSIDAAWCIFGDFNEVRSCNERKNSSFNRMGAANFNNLISTNSLIDIPMGGKKFTRISDDGLKFSKLDCFLTNVCFCDNWSSLAVVAKERKLSDHGPLVLNDKVIDFWPKPFRCFDILMEDIECDRIVADCWRKMVYSINPDSIFRDKLKNVKEAESRDLEVAELERWKEARREWIEKDRCKNEMIRQKARSKWVLEGDENSKKLHASINRNNRKTRVNGLMIDGCYYKIIAKILVERMKKVIDKVVGEEQNAFIHGRYILDGSLIANEAYDYLKNEKKKAFLLKIDFEKAYDNVNWKFIQHTLLQMGFGEKWCKWIEALAEWINVTIKQAFSYGYFKDVEIGSSAIPILHLQYADDTLIFKEWKESNARNLMRIMECVKQASGLKINLNKTKLYGGGNNTFFWLDSWMGNEIILNEKFPRLIVGLDQVVNTLAFGDRGQGFDPHPLQGRRLYRLEMNQRITVGEKIWEGESWGWQWDWARNLRELDSWTWLHDDDGIFTFKRLREMIDDKILNKTKWNKLIPRVMEGWNKVFKWWKMGRVNIGSIQDIISHDDNNSLNLKEKSIWQALRNTTSMDLEPNETLHQRKKNGRMMLESIDNGPLVYPTVKENGQIRNKKYAELTEQEKLQDDCDVQATNIILQGLPPDVCPLVNHHQAAKDI
ncbi:RNA-directed DNA polymerase, eukaryota [Tanacetum coccineum]